MPTTYTCCQKLTFFKRERNGRAGDFGNNGECAKDTLRGVRERRSHRRYIIWTRKGFVSQGVEHWSLKKRILPQKVKRIRDRNHLNFGEKDKPEGEHRPSNRCTVPNRTDNKGSSKGQKQKEKKKRKIY